MWRSRMFWQLFLTCGLLIVFSVGLLGVVVGSQVERNELHEIEEGLKAQALLIRELIRDKDVHSAHVFKRLEAIAGELGIRITFVAEKGAVLVETDKDPESMENHGSRPEVVEARQDRFGKSIRYSATLNQEMMYLALRTDLATSEVAFIRVALPLTSVRAQVSGLLRLIWLAAGLTGALALGLAFLLARRVVRPVEELTRGAQEIAAGAYGHRVRTQSRGEIGQLANAFNHMSERLAAQFAQLDEDRQQLRTVLSSMVEGVLAIDNEERLLFANERACQLLDFPSGNAVGRHLWELARFRPVLDVVRAALDSSKPVQRELSWTAPTPRALLVHASRLPGLPSRGVLLVLHDNTELRRLEQVRREFVANVSHELKTPLAVIQASVETLIDGAAEDPSVRGQFLERVADQAHRLHNLIQDLLHLARIESETQAFLMETLPVGRIVDESLEEHRPLAKSRRQRLASIPPPTEEAELTTWADEEALRQILDNLVANALKYTPEGGLIQVSWGRRDARIFVEVRDTGIGIAEADLARVFERFYRVDKARSRELGGTGLGLSIVKHLVQAMNGSIEATSRLGEGSLFVVMLPEARQPLAEPLSARVGGLG